MTGWTHLDRGSVHIVLKVVKIHDLLTYKTQTTGDFVNYIRTSHWLGLLLFSTIAFETHCLKIWTSKLRGTLLNNSYRAQRKCSDASKYQGSREKNFGWVFLNILGVWSYFPVVWGFYNSKAFMSGVLTCKTIPPRCAYGIRTNVAWNSDPTAGSTTHKCCGYWTFMQTTWIETVPSNGKKLSVL